MGGEWVQRRLGEICSFAGGTAFPKKHQGATNGSIPFIKVSDMNLPANARRIVESNNWIEEDIAEQLSARRHPADAVVFAKIGVALTYNRRRVLTQPTVIDNNMMAAIPDPCAVDPLFLYYLLTTVDFNQVVSGTALPYLNAGDLARLDVEIPTDKKEQRAIAHILGTLDDKIELNRRMSETLEAMARALFKSWFVDFDPVRAKMEGRWRRGQSLPGLPAHLYDLFPDKLVPSELGEIPEGWDVAALDDAIEVNPKRSLRRGEPAPYLDMAGMPTKGHAPDAVAEREFGSGMRFTNGDTLVARITPCLENGKTAFVDFLQDGQVGWGSTEYIVLRPKPPLPGEFAYCLARSPEFRDFAIQSMTGSSGRQRVPASALSRYLLALPTSPALAEAFGRQVTRLFARASRACAESRTLAALRDTLLPKLISGELRVKDAQRFLREQEP